MYRFVSGIPVRSAGNCHASEYFRSLAGPLCNAARFSSLCTKDRPSISNELSRCLSLNLSRSSPRLFVRSPRANEPTRTGIALLVNDMSLLWFTFETTRVYRVQVFFSAVSRNQEKKISRLCSDDVTRLDTK